MVMVCSAEEEEKCTLEKEVDSLQNQIYALESKIEELEEVSLHIA
jgi:peptidoglycan hydrolase CwlO-like protein